MEFCRRARRLRAQFGGDAARLQAALRDLAAATDRRPRPLPLERLPFSAPAIPGRAAVFSSRVAAALTDGVLRYSARKDLLREAARMGIGRFEATLLIAAVQHQDGDHRWTRYTLDPTPSRLSYGIAAVAVALQAAITSAVWWVVHS